jgi:hypothetical protein
MSIDIVEIADLVECFVTPNPKISFAAINYRVSPVALKCGSAPRIHVTTQAEKTIP